MKRVCVVGSSHIAALKSGIDALLSPPPFAADFFGVPGAAIRLTRIEDGWLVPTKPRVARSFRLVSGVGERIELGAYDAFVVCGYAGVNVTAEVRAGCRTLAMEADEATLVSEDLYLRAANERLLAQQGVQLARMLRAAREVPVMIAQKPFLAEFSRTQSPRRAEVARSADHAEMVRLHALACAGLERLHLRFLPQPPDTIARPFYTLNAFSAGSCKLVDGSEHDGSDFNHMNAAYGARVLRQIAAELGLPPPA